MKRKKGNLSVTSGLTLSTQNAAQMIKTIKFGQTTYKARHVIIPASEIESKTIAHHLNIRSQESLTLDSVRDIYAEVLAEGIKQEGVAYFNKVTGRYELFDATRRRFCGINAKRDLPLWVLDEQPSAKDITAYVDLTQKVKLFSWREVGARYLSHAKEQGIKTDNLDEIAKEFNVSTVTARKKINAAKLNKALVESFPDCQGIPTAYYAKLGKIERTLIKIEANIEGFVRRASSSFDTNATDVLDIQAELLEHYELKLNEITNPKDKPKVTVENLADFKDKNTYARLKICTKTRKRTFELSRLPQEINADIEAYIRKKVAEIG